MCCVLQLSSSLLDPHGPFQMLNALRVLEPQATHNVIVSFGPNAPKEVGGKARRSRDTSYDLLNIKHSSRNIEMRWVNTQFL